jgi:hypothetical protein
MPQDTIRCIGDTPLPKQKLPHRLLLEVSDQIIHALPPSGVDSLMFVVLDSVEADYLGCGSWYPAEVISAQNTGSGWSYSVRYSDGGEEETGKSADGVRGLGGTGKKEQAAECMESAAFAVGGEHMTLVSTMMCNLYCASI